MNPGHLYSASSPENGQMAVDQCQQWILALMRHCKTAEEERAEALKRRMGIATLLTGW